jgi:hypothetical protein
MAFPTDSPKKQPPRSLELLASCARDQFLAQNFEHQIARRDRASHPAAQRNESD